MPAICIADFGANCMTPQARKVHLYRTIAVVQTANVPAATVYRFSLLYLYPVIYWFSVEKKLIRQAEAAFLNSAVRGSASNVEVYVENHSDSTDVDSGSKYRPPRQRQFHQQPFGSFWSYSQHTSLELGLESKKLIKALLVYNSTGTARFPYNRTQA